MQDLPWWKAILMTLGILVAVLGLFAGASAIGLDDMWIAFVAIVIWGAIGMKMENAPAVFVGAAVGLLLSLAIEALPDLYGGWAVIPPVVAIVLGISATIKGALPLLFNPSTFLFLTIGSADIVLDQRLQLVYLPNLAFGAVLFWILPWIVIRLRSGGREPTGP